MGTTSAKNFSLNSLLCQFTNASSLDFEDHNEEKVHYSFKKIPSKLSHIQY